MAAVDSEVGVVIHTGDCVTVMRGMPADSVDAVVTDPPYGIRFMGKAWDGADINALVANRRKAWERRERKGGSASSTGIGSPAAAAGTYNLSLDAMLAFQAWCQQWGREALRVTRPGGYLLAFGGTRTHHRLVCGLEDAGWIIRDELTWVYASGFPKGKANLKPAHEPIVLARKPGPLRPLNIEETRIGTNGGGTDCSFYPGICLGHPGHGKYSRTIHKPARTAVDNADAGRWPSNLLLQDPALFDEPNPEVVGSGATSESASGVQKYQRADTSGWKSQGGMFTHGREWEAEGYGDSGGYSRFFIIPKADRSDREPVVRGAATSGARGYGGGKGVKTRECRQCGDRTQAAQAPYEPACGHGDWEWKDALPIARENAHPTVKPTDLMRHLVRLVTPSGGTVLDCFAGSGSTLIAAELEGFPWIGIEKEPEYVAIAEARLNGTQRGLGLDVGAPTKRTGGPTGMEKGHHPDSYQRHSDKGWSGGWADTPDEEPAA